MTEPNLRNPFNEAYDQLLHDRGTVGYSGYDRPHGENMWDYRVLKTERAIAWTYLHWTDGSQEKEIQRLALVMYHFGGDFGNMAETTSIEDGWTPETKYPDPAYKFMRSSPEGQCGVTNFAFGMLLASTNFVDRKNVYYVEGELYAADGTLLDPDHAWLHVVGEEDQEWRIDLTSHQSAEKNPDPNGFMRIVMQPVRHSMEAHPLINQPPLSTDEYDNYDFPSQNATAIAFREKTRTAIEQYDAQNFKGRLEWLINRLELNALGSWLGLPDNKYAFNLSKEHGLWYPDTYDFHEEGTSELWGGPDEQIRNRIYGFDTTWAADYDLDDERTKDDADADAELGINLARRANKAHTAMQLGELVVTDEYWHSRSKPHDARETFEALQDAAGSLIGRDTLGAYAIEHLFKRS
jgi:hypothetical protein